MEASTVRVPKKLKVLLHSFRLRLSRERKRRVTDAEAIEEALVLAKKNAVVNNEAKTAWQLAGFIKGGEKFNAAKETDSIIYG